MPRKPKRAAPDGGGEVSGLRETGGGPGAGAKAASKGKTKSQGLTGGKGLPGVKAVPGTGRGSGTRTDLSPFQIEAIRQLALDLARKGAGPDAVLICNPISEPSALPAKELLYDRCRWCETDIYYDRLMPSPPGLMRVCLTCGVLLMEAEKKGAN